MSDFAHKWAESIALPFAQRWWVVALRGLFALLFGMIALLAPGATILSLVLLFAAYAFVDGVAELFLAAQCVRAGWRRWLPLLVGGLASIAAAVVALLWPGLTAIVFVLLLAAWSFVSGVMMIASAFRLDASHGKVWFILAGVASILFGLALVVAPLLGAVVLTWWIGVYALILSGALFAMAYRLRSRRLKG
ncbi:HdeD family acid-resistance protein [Hansschlegelia zhihuaiae]|uniref:HdeD family acid-resistance protein n=1 Tax=Hansschlegelia zhihuaiae TaxID=405005 RepID=A0A4Q0MHH2_9HYPH|nr:HdeD family acid-resistance protein [Hansschlegelia zhihuaiae]RXF72753.1 HdeD family acid-resistance protein [Hansschlegelia zhihuaiae]